MLLREKENQGPKWMVNHKHVYRIYREEGLVMRRKKGKRFRDDAPLPLTLPTGANQMWTMDFTRDSLASGRKFRTLNLMDGYTREAPRTEWTPRCRGSYRLTGGKPCPTQFRHHNLSKWSTVCSVLSARKTPEAQLHS
jgi:transposase InsO family protein